MEHLPGAPGLVTLHVWGIARRHIPWALARMARSASSAEGGALRSAPGLASEIRFARLLGTSRGQTFTTTDADPRHWALLTCWSNPAAASAFERTGYAAGWDTRSDERLRLELQPLSSTGQWSGQRPFGPELFPAGSGEVSPAAGAGPCAILTRARLVPRKALAFRRAVPAVAASLQQAAGLRFARGIGEAPVGLQATFSVWDDLAAATNFAYGTPAHRHAVQRTEEVGWYAEQLFARFAVIGASGQLDGRSVA